MHIRQNALGVALIVLTLTPGFALAQGHGPGLGMPGGMGSDRASTQQIQGMIEHMGGMMGHMADRIQAGPLMPEQTKQISEMMGQMTDMMQKLAGMMGGSSTGTSGQGSGMKGMDMHQQMAGMMEKMTEMHKRMMGMMAAPQPDKK